MYLESTSDPIIIGFSALVKAHVSKSGKREIEMEVSNENRDTEGDVIMQQALLRSSDSYIRHGHVDIDHYSELGKNPAYHFLGIKDPDSWIIGVPLEVKDMGEGRTGIKAEIFKSKDGTIDSQKHKFDLFWESLQTDPPARWYASIYGFPGTDTVTGEGGASRYLVKSFDWRSTAVTRNPINNSIKSAARIVTAKAFAAHLPRFFPANERIFSREQMRHLVNEHLTKSCPSTEFGKNMSVWTFRDHFINCDYLTHNLSDLYALATAQLVSRDSRKKVD